MISDHPWQPNKTMAVDDEMMKGMMKGMRMGRMRMMRRRRDAMLV